MTSPVQPEPALALIRQRAEDAAANRRERASTAHLLAAICDVPGVASDLLHERGLDAQKLLRAARSASEDEEDPLPAAVQRAHEVAQSMRAPDPTTLHLLIALLGARRCAGYRVLDQFGVDVGRLRVLAMNAGLGQLGRRRISTRRDERPASTTPAVARGGRAVTIPWAPKPAAITRRPSSPAGAPKIEHRASQLELVGVVAPTQARRAPKKKKAGQKLTLALDSRRFKLLTSIGRNLTLAASKGELAPVVGRDAEVEQVLDILAKREGNNPCLVGVAGVGKTSIVHAVAQRIAAGECFQLDNQILVEISVSELLAGTGVRGALAEKLGELRKEVQASDGRVVLFFDDVHQLCSADSGDELSSELRRALSSGELPCVGTTTPEEYRRSIESDATLARRFARLDVEEPELEHACEILESLEGRFAAHHQVTFSPEALTMTIAWSARFVTGRALPDKAISIIDLAGARARRRGIVEVTKEQVAEIVSEMAQVPVERLLETDAARLLRLEQTVAEKVVGHADKLSRMARIIRRNAAGLGANRPIGTFLLLGPTGVGKTETAKAIAGALFGSEGAMTRLDLSEYSEAHAVARLIGAPPGYLGHEAGGQLTEAVRRRPYQVLLLDEIEKAHAEVLETFLPLFDEGRLTDGRGRTVDFTNTVIILTSNIGAREAFISTKRRLGFGSHVAAADSNGAISERVIAVARETLAPEFFNRIDEVMVFSALEKDEVEEIARRLLQGLVNTVYDQRDIELEVDPSVVALLLAEGGFDATLGARPMKRAIARCVEAPLAEALLAAHIVSGDVVNLTVEQGELEISVKQRETVAAE